MQAEACIMSTANGAGDGVGVLAVLAVVLASTHCIAVFA